MAWQVSAAYSHRNLVNNARLIPLDTVLHHRARRCSWTVRCSHSSVRDTLPMPSELTPPLCSSCFNPARVTGSRSAPESVAARQSYLPHHNHTAPWRTFSVPSGLSHQLNDDECTGSTYVLSVSVYYMSPPL